MFVISENPCIQIWGWFSTLTPCTSANLLTKSLYSQCRNIFVLNKKYSKGQGRTILVVSKHLNNNFYLLCAILKIFFTGIWTLTETLSKNFTFSGKCIVFYQFNAIYAYLEPKEQIWCNPLSITAQKMYRNMVAPRKKIFERQKQWGLVIHFDPPSPLLTAQQRLTQSQWIPCTNSKAHCLKLRWWELQRTVDLIGLLLFARTET